MARLRSLLALAAVLALPACSRGISVGSPEPARTYSISVQNQTPVAMIVSYNDGRGDALLGNVAAGATERFIIAGSAASTIQVSASAVSGSRRSGPYTVTLTAGQTQTVTLR